LELKLVSGAGYGDPKQRDPSAVWRDYCDGLISANDAHHDYGVVFNADNKAVDWEATAQLRQQRDDA
jgi:N-methylhydantoinase B/oxoprolinase/acetone carboxylase alpha subunit